jgi:hypothetical protein
MYSTRKFWRILAIIAVIVLLAGKIPWGTIRAKPGLRRIELRIRRIEYRIGEMLQNAADKADKAVRNWGRYQ